MPCLRNSSCCFHANHICHCRRASVIAVVVLTVGWSHLSFTACLCSATTMSSLQTVYIFPVIAAYHRLPSFMFHSCSVLTINNRLFPKFRLCPSVFPVTGSLCHPITIVIISLDTNQCAYLSISKLIFSLHVKQILCQC